MGVDVAEETDIFRRLHLKDLHGHKIYTNLAPLGFSKRTTAGSVPITKGKCWENLQKVGSGIVPSPKPSPKQSHKAVKWVALPGGYLRLYSTQFTGAFSKICRKSKQL